MSGPRGLPNGEGGKVSDAVGRTVLVTGFSRCGTTLAMTMLAAGGFPVVGKWPYEVPETLRTPWRREFAAQCAGRAVKVLEPIHFPPPAAPYRVIPMRRDPEAQAQSHRRFLRTVAGIPVPRDYVPKLARTLPGLYRQAEQMFTAWGASVTVEAFEDVIGAPERTARRWQIVLDAPLDIARMVSVVVPRSPGLAPELLEPALMERFG
jgi:hypothetical protein